MTFTEELTRDIGCRADLLWRCDLLDGTQTAEWVELATAAEFTSVPGSSRLGVAVLQDRRSGHRIVAVLRTGRVQIRLDAMTPRAQRASQARELFERLRGLRPQPQRAPTKGP